MTRALLVLSLVYALAGCRHAAPEARVSIPCEPLRIVVLGSSTAAGTGPKHQDSTWVNRYRRTIRAIDTSWTVVNLAKGGYTTHRLLPTGSSVKEGRDQPDSLHNITKAMSLQPSVIIINLPSNDANQNVDVQETLANYETILAVAVDRNVPVWLTTTQPRNFTDDRKIKQTLVRDALRARYGSKVIDFWTGIAASDGSVNPRYDSGDGIHLNDRAHGILHDRVVAAGIPARLRPAECLQH